LVLIASSKNSSLNNGHKNAEADRHQMKLSRTGSLQ
jgi:hypothetical protein